MCDNVLGWFAQHRQAKAAGGAGSAQHITMLPQRRRVCLSSITVQILSRTPALIRGWAGVTC